ncbi:MAG TPA: RNA methyltransferase [Marinagarivorans sp.]
MKPCNVVVGLCNPKSPSNVGAVMRAAGCYRVCAVRYSGERFARAAKYHTDTKNINAKIPLESTRCILENIPAEMAIVCVELVEGAEPLPEFEHPNQAIYIFGPEDGSIEQAVIDRASAVVYVPTIGCMNLAATVNVVLYDRMAKSLGAIDHNRRIKASRDVNNRLSYSPI